MKRFFLITCCFGSTSTERGAEMESNEYFSKIEFEEDKLMDKSLKKKINTNIKKNNIYFFPGKFFFVEK